MTTATETLRTGAHHPHGLDYLARGAFYAGKNADGHRITLEWAVSRQQNPASALTITHEPVPYGAVCLSFTFTETDPKLRRDGGIVSCGAGAPEAARSVVVFDGNLDAEELARWADLAERWHLSSLQAGCAHMPDREALAEQVPDNYPQQYGRPDVTGWAIENVRCPETGYRWGSAWLADPPPWVIVDEVAALADKGADPEAIYERRGYDASGRAIR